MKRSHIVALLVCLFAGQAFGQGSSPEPIDPVILVVKARDAELAAAHGRGDMTTYLQGLSKRYVYVDVGGRRVTPDTLATRRGNDQLRQVASELSEEEAIRIADGVVLLRGLEKARFTYFGGLPREGSTRWTALWAREEDRQWRLVAETATPVASDAGLPFTPSAQPASVIRARQGRWSLALPDPMVLGLTAESGKLIGKLEGHDLQLTFVPASPTHFFALERPFELRFTSDGKALTLMTWGIPTAAHRLSGTRH
jgi:ketosteroid isomerase-like protein